MSIPTKDNKEIIESVGIEMEFCSINRSDPNFQERLYGTLLGYKVEHDASVETPLRTFLNYPVILKDAKAIKRLSPFLGRLTVGGEIISPIRNSNSPHWVEEIENLCEILIEHGETEDTVRDSFHVHVNITRDVPLFVLKNVLQFTLAFEAFFFRLGGMGRPNRGITNDYIFSRPYLGNGPPVIVHGRRNYPIMNPDHLMDAKDKEDFFRKYGDAYFLAGRVGKYVTPRYMSINFYPILTQGSLEFRTANKTLNPRYIIAWTNLCKAIVSKSFSSRKLTIEGLYPLAENRDIPTREFLRAIEMLELDNDTQSVLLEIWETSPVPIFDNVWRYSHLPNPTGYSNDYLPDPLDIKTKVEKARHIDVHALENVDERLDGEGLIPFRAGRNVPPLIHRPRRMADILEINPDANNVFAGPNAVGINIQEMGGPVPVNANGDIFDDDTIIDAQNVLRNFLHGNAVLYLQLTNERLFFIGEIPFDLPFYNSTVRGFDVRIIRSADNTLRIDYWIDDFDSQDVYFIRGVDLPRDGILNLQALYEEIHQAFADAEGN